MRSSPLIIRSLILLLSIIAPVIIATPGDCGSLVLWHNTCNTGGITGDFNNTNIDISGCNALNGPVQVNATTCDVLITITNGSAEITGLGGAGSLATPPGLYLNAIGHTITILMTADLLFRGTTDDNGNPQDLLVAFDRCTFSGGELSSGLINFQIAGGQTLTFTSLPGTGGVYAYVVMSNSSTDLGKVEVSFTRPDVVSDPAPNSDVKVVVGNKSTLSYLSDQAISINGGGSDQGTITFDTTNPGTGRMILDIGKAGGEVLIAGRLLNSVSCTFALSDIDQTQPAGNLATFNVLNNSMFDSGSLLVINENTAMTNFQNDPFCDDAFTTYGGVQHGFILGSNANLVVNPNTYLDYVGTTTNSCPNLNLVLSEELTEVGLDKSAIVKERNASAFIVDQNNDPLATRPQINLNQPAAIYFRSAADEDGIYNVTTFTIDPLEMTPGAGNLIFDVEGQVDVIGLGVDSVNHTGLHVLSLQVTPTGGPVLVGSGETTFPLRTCATSGGTYVRYNSAYMFINGRLNLNSTSLIHDDENHIVYEKNDTESEPTYVGGDHKNLIDLCICSGDSTCSGLRPKIVFINSDFRVNTSVALTGVDLLVPNNPSAGNQSYFVFYGNGRALDNGTGRQMILGTDIGSFACDGGTVINRDSHLDVYQESQDDFPLTQNLTLTTQFNDGTVNCLLRGGSAPSGASVHTIYLGHSSNISMGTNGSEGTTADCSDTFDLTTFPTLTIGDCYFSFDTRGGCLNYPETSNVTGQGGIFVDTNGVFNVVPTKRANISTMVTKSGNAQVNLPPNQIFFNSRVGIANWQINLNNPDQRIIILPGSYLSDYTLDWIATTKAYNSGYVPYELCNVYTCNAPAVTTANITGLPEVHGTVDQFQIKRSRIGDQVALLVGRGGFIRELVFLTGYDSAEAPTGFIVIQDDARVGLGSTHKNVDSLDSSIFLGVNGVTLIPNGNGEVILNEDLIVNNVCHILAGPDFGATEPNFLSITAPTQRQLTIKQTGTLDLSSFTTTNQILEFAGQVNLVLETGSTVILGGGMVRFVGSSQINVQQTIEELPVGTPPVTTLDTQRAVFVGTGTVLMLEESKMIIHEESICAVQTAPPCVPTTNITWAIQDSADVIVGDLSIPGGAFQIGDPLPNESSSITFSLVLNGNDATFELSRQGFLGLGVGIISKPFNAEPNTWVMGTLNNISNITIDIQDGRFLHNDITDGDNQDASLMAIGSNDNNETAIFGFSFIASNAVIRGGGNVVYIDPNTDSITPVVTDVNGTIDGYRVGIMSSRGHLVDRFSSPQPFSGNAAAYFNYLKIRDYRNATKSQMYASPKAAIAENTIDTHLVAYVQSSIIYRQVGGRIIGEGGVFADPTLSLNEGSVNLLLNQDNSVASLIAYTYEEEVQ